MSKLSIAASAALVGLGLTATNPALAGEGNGEPFPQSFGVTRLSNRVARDIGHSQYPDVTGRPGSNLSVLADGQVLPAPGNEQALQTANSLPRGAEDGMVTYTQGTAVLHWITAHGEGAKGGPAAG